MLIIGKPRPRSTLHDGELASWQGGELARRAGPRIKRGQKERQSKLANKLSVFPLGLARAPFPARWPRTLVTGCCVRVAQRIVLSPATRCSLLHIAHCATLPAAPLPSLLLPPSA